MNKEATKEYFKQKGYHELKKPFDKLKSMALLDLNSDYFKKTREAKKTDKPFKHNGFYKYITPREAKRREIEASY